MIKALNIRSLVSVFIIMILAGSSSVKVKPVSYQFTAQDLHDAQWCDSTRIHFDLKAIEIAKEIKDCKERGDNIPARVLNNLYSNFYRQLEFDLLCFDFLEDVNFKYDTLNNIQRRALKYLLMVSHFYHNTYSSNEYVHRILNLGNSSYDIPANLLMAYESILFSKIYREALLRGNDSIDDFDYAGFLDCLPPPLSEVEEFIDLEKNIDLPLRTFESLTFNGVYVFSSIVGYFEGSYEARHNATKLLEVLEPFDIILMKSSQNFTDFFIPGYFGHSGIWLGGDDFHLFNQGKLELDINSPYIIEAVREGVKMSSLEAFASGEVFLVLRIKNLSLAQKVSIFQNSTMHLGKNYDFNFDSEASDMISCPELVFLSYDFIEWKSGSLLNKTFITPDDIFSTAMDDTTIEIVALIKDGMLIYDPNLDQLNIQRED